MPRSIFSWPASRNRGGASFAADARATAIDQQRLAFGILAGEPPGDLPGPGLMQASRTRIVDVQFCAAARRVPAAAHVTRVKFGTATLDAMLFRKPVVVTYRLGALSYRNVKTLLPIPLVALANTLAGVPVPDLIRATAEPAPLAAASVAALRRGCAGVHTTDFRMLHLSPRRGAHRCTTAPVFSLLSR